MENFFVEATWVVRLVGLWIITRVVGEMGGFGASIHNAVLARRAAKHIKDLAVSGALCGNGNTKPKAN